MERRSIKARVRTFRAEGDDVPKKISLRIPYNSLSEDLGGFREMIAPGAFTRCLRDNSEVMSYWNHDTSKPLARRSNGSLSLDDDLEALFAEMDAPDDDDDPTTWEKDCLRCIRSGNVKGASFAFDVPEGGDEWERTGGMWMRTLRDVNLADVSPVSEPAYGESEASVS
jgi:HK97 family phage prohead protease